MLCYIRYMIFILLSTLLLAQEPDGYRWKEIERDTMQIGLGLTTPSVELEIRPPNSSAKDLIFAPNTSTSTNLILGSHSATLAFAISSSDNSENEVSTTHQDFSYRSYFRQHGFELYYQAYKGFYQKKPPSTYVLPDLKLRRFGVNYFYTFRPRLYSLDAALGNNSIQTKSGGSFLLIASLDFFSIDNQGLIVPATFGTSYGEAGQLSSIKSTSLNVGGGYGYTLVFFDSWYATSSFTIPVGISYIRYQGSDATTAAISLNSKIALGYNAESFRFAVSVDQNSQYLELKDDSEIIGNSYEIGINFIYRRP